MLKLTRKLWLVSLSPLKWGGGVPLSPPLDDTAATVTVCPVPPVVAAMLAAPPASCPDMVGGMYVSVFGPEVATITGALGATGG